MEYFKKTPQINCTKQISMKPTRTPEVVENLQYFSPVATGPEQYKEWAGARIDVQDKIDNAEGNSGKYKVKVSLSNFPSLSF